MKTVELEGISYEIIRDEKDGYDEEMLKTRYTDYYKEYDYIVGDIAYSKLRLKGFYADDSKNAKDINRFRDVDKYIENYCAYGCKYFILKKVK